MRGDLSDFNIEALLQVFGSNRATGALVIQHHSGRQFIAYLQNGKVVHAQYDAENGVDALAALMLAQSGSFEFKYGVVTDERTIQGASEWTLMSAANRADERPPALHSEISMKRKTFGQPAPELLQNTENLGRSSRPLDSEAPRSVKSQAGSNESKAEALETMLRSNIFNLHLGNKPIIPAVVIKNQETPDANLALRIDLDFAFEETEQAESQIYVTKASTNPTPSYSTFATSSPIAPTSQGVPLIPINIHHLDATTDNRSHLPASVIREWQQALGRTIMRMELRIHLERRGLVLAVTSDDALEDKLLLPSDLANRLKLVDGAIVWVGPA